MKKIVIQTKNLCKSYILGKQGQNVLKNIDLEIYEGDFTVIMGRSGSGKSTLLYSISSMDKPTAGEVKLFGRDIQAFGEKEIASVRKNEIAFVFQQINLLSDLSVFENVAYIGYGERPKKEVNQRVEELLKRVGLLENANKFPSELSGGEQQRVAIARALINQPRMIFADEPTGALNSMAGQDVLNLLSELNNKGQSVIMVTHDIKACMRGNRLIYLGDGRIVGDLNIGKYNPVEEEQREAVIFKFLREHGW